MDNNTKAFLELVKAGLWEQDIQLSKYAKLDFQEIMRLADEQSVVGLVAAGLEHVVDIKLPKEVVLQFVGQALQLEQRNSAMNIFIAELVNAMQKKDIFTLLVKGQGIAQCYERPNWRASGDVDLFLDEFNFERASNYLSSIADSSDVSRTQIKHFSFSINDWEVEIHGTLHSRLNDRIDHEIDAIQKITFDSTRYREWNNSGTTVFLPNENEDVFYVFTHILQHLFSGGIGLRQVCDWSRLLWTYRNTIDIALLESRIKNMRLWSEWRVFAGLAVDYLGMPKEAMPFYDKSYSRKALRVLSYIIDVGNFGHNRDSSYISKYPSILRRIKTFLRQASDNVRLAYIFPYDSTSFLFYYIKRSFSR